MAKSPTKEELEASHREIDRETDRHAAILAGSLIEDALTQAIEGCFVPLSNTKRVGLFEGFGPLATFAAKIEIGHALGLFGNETRLDLHRIKSIRNKFAHVLTPLTFASPEVAKNCSFGALDVLDALPPARKNRVAYTGTVYHLAAELLRECAQYPRTPYPPMAMP
jgi:hypothetical protein